MAFGDLDARMMAHDAFGVPVVYGGQTCSGVLNQQDELVPGEEGTAFALRETTLRYYTADLVGVVEDTSILVDSVSYEVRDVRVTDDGLHTILTLAP